MVNWKPARHVSGTAGTGQGLWRSARLPRPTSHHHFLSSGNLNCLFFLPPVGNTFVLHLPTSGWICSYSPHQSGLLATVPITQPPSLALASCCSCLLCKTELFFLALLFSHKSHILDKSPSSILLCNFSV